MVEEFKVHQISYCKNDSGPTHSDFPRQQFRKGLISFAEEPAPFQNSNGRNDGNIMAGSFLF